MFDGLKVTEGFKTLAENAVAESRLSHALILEGADEETREKVAKEIAEAILCKGKERPCGFCSSCMKVKSGNHPDLHLLKKDEKAAMIKVDSIRDIKKQALVYPNDGDKSVFIICEGQFMNVQAQNALLKIFEEPSPHVHFIITCNSKSSLLETIISRGTAYLLSEEGSESKNEKAREKAAELMEYLAAENELQFLRRTAIFQKDKQLFRDVLEETVPILRDVMILQSGGNALISGCDTTVKKLKTALTQRQTMELIEKVSELYENVLSSGNHNLQTTRFSAVLYSIVKG